MLKRKTKIKMGTTGLESCVTEGRKGGGKEELLEEREI
jgi:hypothetical protein